MLRMNLFKLVVLVGMSFLGNAVLAQKFTLFTDLKTPSTPGQKLNKEELPTRQVKLNEEVLQAISQEAPSKLLLSVPLFTGQETILELERKEVVTADFKVTESGQPGKAAAYQPGVYYQGHIRALPKSIVAISFFKAEVMGTILLENTVFSFGKHDPKENLPANVYKLINENALLTAVGTSSLPSLCGTADDISAELSETMSRLSASAVNPEEPTTGALLSDVIKIYFECDQKMYLDRGSSTTATVNYVTSLFNIVQTLYTNEQINTQISEVFVWTTADGYPTNSSFSALAAFGNRRGPNPINGNIAQLLSTNTNNLGGIAWLDVLCDVPTFVASQGTYVGPISYSNIGNSFAAFPTYSWTTMVVTHELGHNIGSPHTQSCSWPGGALDNCYQTEGGCPAGPAPINGGTIMSYCHLTSSGINFNNGFGTLPGNLIRDRVSNATCLTAGGGGGPCDLSVSPTSINYATAGGSQIITITSASAWTAFDDASWLTLTSTSGGGNATITATALANTGVARTATITVTCGATTRTITVSQAGVPSCTLSTNPTAINFSTSSGSRQLTINSSTSWTASDDATWLTLSRTSGSSSTNITVSAQANTGAARTATITVTCGLTTVTVTVSQAGTGSGCILNVSPTSLTYTAAGGGQNISITSSAAWTASDNAAWLSLNTTSGSGNATIIATAQTNTGTARTATITVTCGGTTRTITVSQDAASAGCTLTVDPTTLNYTATGGGQNVSITSSAAWTASDDANWLSLNSTSGSGNATIIATAQTNTGTARTATITVTCGGTTRTISVSQAAASAGGCTLSVNPTTLTYTSNSGSQNVAITSSAAWTASDNATWLTLNSTSGSGNATISATAQANSSSIARSATITVTCGSSTATISVSQPGRSGRLTNDLIANPEEFDLAVAPNPVKTMLNINWQQPEDADVILQLFDMNGRLIWQKRYAQLENGTYSENLEVSTYAPGTYILRLNTPKQPIMKRIIIE